MMGFMEGLAGSAEVLGSPLENSKKNRSVDGKSMGKT